MSIFETRENSEIVVVHFILSNFSRSIEWNLQSTYSECSGLFKAAKVVRFILKCFRFNSRFLNFCSKISILKSIETKSCHTMQSTDVWANAGPEAPLLSTFLTVNAYVRMTSNRIGKERRQTISIVSSCSAMRMTNNAPKNIRSLFAF